ncbi:MAG: dockerin type I repeat-containing protein [Armatimonadota bacterium]|nr:dockerin type I repeat-containing protein [Armatimonadota bacterium]
MKRVYGLLVASLSALTLTYAPAQIVYSFETPDLHGYADDNAPGYLEVFQATEGVTHGSYSMGVRWPGGFRWMLGNGVRDETLPYLQLSRKLLLDVTVPAGVSVPWASLIVSFNDPQLGWRQVNEPVGLPRVPGRRTILLDLESLALPAPEVEWFQVNLGINAGGPHEVYMDSLRLYRSACEMPAFSFDSDLQGFNVGDQSGVSVEWVNGKMRVTKEAGFRWLYGGTVPGLAAMVRRGDLVVFDVTVVESASQWANAMVAINSPAGWGQSDYIAEIPTRVGVTRTVALDYRGVDLPSDDNPDYCLLNIAFNSGGYLVLDVDNIRIYRRVIDGDVNCDGIVNNADLLAVLFEFGSTAITPADLNGDGTVNNADLLIVLFNFGQGG